MHCELLLKDSGLIWHLRAHPRLLFRLQVLLLLLLLLLPPILLLDLLLQGLLDRVLLLLPLLHHDGLLVTALEDGPAGLQLEVRPTLQHLPTRHNLREVTLGAGRVLIHVGTIIGRVVGATNGVSLVWVGSIDQFKV